MLLFILVLIVTLLLVLVPLNADLYSSPKLVDEDYYVVMRTDRSGAAVHDMLMAHAYIYMKQKETLDHNTKVDMEEVDGAAKASASIKSVHSAQALLKASSTTYVVRGQIIDNRRRPRINFAGICALKKGTSFLRTVELTRDLGLDRYALPIRCPPGSLSSCDERYNSNTTVVLLNEVTYRQYDSHLFTNEWQLYLRSQMELGNTNAAYSARGPTTNRPLTVAVHVRRGDVNPCRFPQRFLSDNHYIRLVEEYALKGNKRKDVEVVVYSESRIVFEYDEKKNSSFDVFIENNYKVALDTPINETWKEMMDADILIISKSSFSYVPALFNPNKVVYTPFWHEQPPNLKHWVTVSDHLVQIAEEELNEITKKLCKKT